MTYIDAYFNIINMKTYKDPQIPVQHALDQFKSQDEVAEVLNITKGLVSQWKKLEFVPPLHAYRLLQIKPRAFKGMR